MIFTVAQFVNDISLEFVCVGVAAEVEHVTYVLLVLGVGGVKILVGIRVWETGTVVGVGRRDHPEAGEAK